MTAKRAAILQILQESHGHLQADEIYRLAKERFPGMVLATVYNNLHALCAAGLIREIKMADGANFYDKTPTPHEHATCTKCGRLLDLDLGDLGAMLATKSDLPICSYELVVHTVCPMCETKSIS